MIVKFFYDTAVGRMILKGIMNSGLLSVTGSFLCSPASGFLIKPYIRHNRIDMRDFQGQNFRSFADFFARKRSWTVCCGEEADLISPCDGLLSIYPVNEDSKFVVKGSVYRVRDLIPDDSVTGCFVGGCCLIYRLRASDYHHFCYLDDCYHGKPHYVEGVLHSVQPIACVKEPVYRLNRRVWSMMETRHFGLVAQIEVGALLVGGIAHEKENDFAKRGEEMGHFELAGSTLIQFFTEETLRDIRFQKVFQRTLQGKMEIPVEQGQIIGSVRK